MNAGPTVARPPVRALVHGATGRMGQALLRLAREREDLQVVAAVSRSIGQRVVDGVPQFKTSELPGTPAFDVAIDFSLAEGFGPILALCAQRGSALVSGTTGLADGQREDIERASSLIPVLWTANFSLGVAVLTDLVERAARMLHAWDCDIIEAHHSRKQDAPSGTALALAAAAERGGSVPRCASIRAGDIVGEHMVQFTGHGERVELIHRAGNRDIFANGALHAAVRLAGRAPGKYRLGDLLE